MRLLRITLALTALVCALQAADTVKIGNVVPYTGAFSEYGATGKAEAAYFQMINDRGGINGRKIDFISLDSGSDTAKAVALARQLVEQDQVLLTIGIWGTPANLAIRQYMNDQKTPQLFVNATDSAFDDPAHFPWTMGFQPSKRVEALVYARYVLRHKPGAKVAMLYGRDPSSGEWRQGIRGGLGDKASTMIVKEAAVDYSDPQGLDARIVALKNSGADVFMNLVVGRLATHAIRKAYEIGWRPLEFIPNASLPMVALLEPGGREKAAGTISNARSKSWLTAEAQQDPEVRAFVEWMHKYNAEANLRDASYVYGYEVAEATVEVLKKCGPDLTRANVMKQAASLDLTLSMLRPGIRVTTGPADYQPIKQLYLIRFDGRDWAPLSDPIGN